MAFEVVPTAAGRLHSDQYTKIIIINTPINLSLPLLDSTYMYSFVVIHSSEDKPSSLPS